MAESFSYSKIDTYEQCGFKYKLTYVDGHYIHSDNVATEFGSAIHKTEEEIGKAIMAGLPIPYIKLKNDLIKCGYELEFKYGKAWSEEKDKSDRTYPQKLNEYLTSGIYRLELKMKEHPDLELVGLEVPFQFLYNGHQFKGLIDRVLRNNKTGKYIIQDIKTYAVPLERAKLKSPLQFVVYIMAAQELYDCTEVDIECSYDLPLCNVEQPAGSDGFVAVGKTMIDKFFADIEAKIFVPNPSPLCYWCQYSATNPDQPEEGKNLCPYHSLWTKENKKNFHVAFDWLGLENHEVVLEKYIKSFGTEDRE